MPRNPFDAHGIKHLSASSLNLYRNEPALWVLRYLKKIKDESGPAAWRGSAVEAGLDWAVMKERFEAGECHVKALERFEQEAAGERADDIDKERNGIGEFLGQAIAALKPHGVPAARQLKIEHWLDGIEVPLIGYIDYAYADKLIDLKTTWRIPSEPRSDHAMQVAIYHKATGKTPFLAYVSNKRFAVYAVEDIDAALADASRAAKALRNLLATVDNADTAARLFAPNFDSYYWNDTMKNHALAVWN